MLHVMALFLLLPSTALGAGSCTVVPMEESWSDYTFATTNRARRYWCQANCPVAETVTDSHAICPFFDLTQTAQACNQSWSTPPSCNHGFTTAACPPAFVSHPGDPSGPGSTCLGCVQSQMQCSTCNAAALCSTTNGFSVSHKGVTGSTGSCDHSDGELTTCSTSGSGGGGVLPPGRRLGGNGNACGYLCTGHCERGFSSSWNCNTESQANVVTRCERAVRDSPSAGCGMVANEMSEWVCDNGCMALFLQQVQAGQVSGWDISYPLGNSAAVLRGSVSLALVLAMGAMVCVVR